MSSLAIFGSEVEVIELHENKSLDQMVLDQISSDQEMPNELIDAESWIKVGPSEPYLRATFRQRNKPRIPKLRKPWSPGPPGSYRRVAQKKKIRTKEKKLL